jgi:enamine deaminase RidA (YjgF/YER057c/UK114 family)
MTNIQKTLEKYGSSINKVVKCTIMLADIKEWEKMNSVYTTFFSDHLSVRSAFGTNSFVAGARIEIECWATTK